MHMKSMLTRSRSTCLGGHSGGGGGFWWQHQEDTVRVVRVDTLQLLLFSDPLTVAELLHQLNVPHHCVFQVASAGSASAPPSSTNLRVSASAASPPQAPQRIRKGPLLAPDAELDLGGLYFLKPLPTLLCKLRRSRRAAASPLSLLSDNPYAHPPAAAHDLSCCCASAPAPQAPTDLLALRRSPSASSASSTTGTSAFAAASPTRPACFATSLVPDAMAAAGKQTPPHPPHQLTRSRSLKRTWSAIAGFLHHHSSSFKHPNKRTSGPGAAVGPCGLPVAEALDLVVQATSLADEDLLDTTDPDAGGSGSGSGSAASSGPLDATGASSAPSPPPNDPAVKAIVGGWYCPSQIMRSSWKPELRGICERTPASCSFARPAGGYTHCSSASIGAQLGSRDRAGGAAEEAGQAGGRRKQQSAAAAESSSSQPATTTTTTTAAAAAAKILQSCTSSNSKKVSRWNRDLSGLASFGGGFGGAMVPSWR